MRQHAFFNPVRTRVLLITLFVVVLSGIPTAAQQRIGDNLGNHKALQALNMNTYNINDIGSIWHRTISISNLSSGGVIGTAINTVDSCSVFIINQTASEQTLSLPSPSVTTAGRMVYVINSGTVSFTLAGTFLLPNSAMLLIYTGSTWVALNVNVGNIAPIVVETSNYTVALTDYTVVLGSGATGGATFTLPSSPESGRTYRFVNLSSAYYITFSAVIHTSNNTTTTTLGVGTSNLDGTVGGNKITIQWDATDSEWIQVAN